MRIALTLALFLAAAPLRAQVGVVAGRVVAAGTREPLAGAVVRVAGTTLGASTDSLGRFVVRDVPVGIRALEVRRLGYAPLVRSDIAVSVARPAEVLVELEPAAARLDAVTVRPSPFPTLPPASTPVSTQRFSAEEVRRAPGIQEDVVRAVSVFPGVGVTTAGRNDLVVRGGAPFENLFLVDNVEVPNINHFGAQGSTGGPVSLVNIDFVQDASLSAGGFGVRYGDRTASATSITLREGTRERASGEVNLSATGYGLVVEGPLPGGSILAGVRRSYLDLLFKALGASFIPAYTDATLKASVRPTRRDQLSLLVIGAVGTVTFDNDDADKRFENSTVLAPEQDQYFSGLTWMRTLAKGVATTTLGRTWTRYRSLQADSGGATGEPATVFRAFTTEGETSLRTDLLLQPTPTLTLELGDVAKYASALDFDVAIPGEYRRDAAGVARALAVDTSFTAWRNATYAQATAQLAPRLRATAGARVDWYGFLDDAVRFAPRASATWDGGGAGTFSLAGGRYWQAPPFIWLVGDAANARLRPFRADQLVAGWSRTLRPDVKLQLEAYAKRYDGYPARVFRPQAVLQPSGFDDVTNDIPFGLEPLAGAGRGRAWGVEALVQKKLAEIPVYGLVSASLNRTEFEGLDGRVRRGAFDTPVIVNALAGWRPNPSWELSARARGATGLPYTPFVTEGEDAGRLDFARYNAGGRLPTFFALDVRADRRWTLGRTQLITYIDVQNATGRANVSRYSWDGRERAVIADESLGVLPSLGVTLEF